MIYQNFFKGVKKLLELSSILVVRVWDSTHILNLLPLMWLKRQSDMDEVAGGAIAEGLHVLTGPMPRSTCRRFHG